MTCSVIRMVFHGGHGAGFFSSMGLVNGSGSDYRRGAGIVAGNNTIAAELSR